MKKLLLLACAAPLLSGCLGFSSSDNKVVGQVKRVQHATPLICLDYDHVDLSMGVMRNGVGSMSNQDMWLYVPSVDDSRLLQAAAASGQLVEITYSTARFRFCVDEEMVTHVELLK